MADSPTHKDDKDNGFVIVNGDNQDVANNFEIRTRGGRGANANLRDRIEAWANNVIPDDDQVPDNIEMPALNNSDDKNDSDMKDDDDKASWTSTWDSDILFTCTVEQFNRMFERRRRDSERRRGVAYSSTPANQLPGPHDHRRNTAPAIGNSGDAGNIDNLENNPGSNRNNGNNGNNDNTRNTGIVDGVDTLEYTMDNADHNMDVIIDNFDRYVEHYMNYDFTLDDDFDLVYRSAVVIDPIIENAENDHYNDFVACNATVPADNHNPAPADNANAVPAVNNNANVVPYPHRQLPLPVPTAPERYPEIRIAHPGPSLAPVTGPQAMPDPNLAHPALNTFDGQLLSNNYATLSAAGLVRIAGRFTIREIWVLVNAGVGALNLTCYDILNRVDASVRQVASDLDVPVGHVLARLRRHRLENGTIARANEELARNANVTPGADN